MVVRDAQGRVCSQKHGMCKRKIHFLHVYIGKDQSLQQHAESAMFVQDKTCGKKRINVYHHLPPATRAEKRSEAHRYVNQSQKNIKKLYSTTHRRFAKLPKPMTLQSCEKSAGFTTFQHPFRGLEPQTLRAKHQASAPSLPILLYLK